jgi:hypothetical protein
VDPKGIRSPLQGRMTLQCAACHQPDASRRGFEPVSMTKHCQECHALQFEPAVTTREVPHGKAAAAVTVIDEFYANLALRGVRDSFQKAFGVPGEGLLRRVGEPSPDERREALGLASRKAKQVSEELFEVRVCKTCHDVTRAAVSKAQAPEWRIAPIRANNQWMPHARFDHKSHASAPCADCHNVANSKNASDVAMPPIACRNGHGARAVEGKVMCTCCHGSDARIVGWLTPKAPKGPLPLTSFAIGLPSRDAVDRAAEAALPGQHPGGLRWRRCARVAKRGEAAGGAEHRVVDQLACSRHSPGAPESC